MSAGKETKNQNKNSRQGLFSNGREPTEGAWDWGSVDPRELTDLIQMVTVRGGAIRFGYSRDGNAGSIGIYYGDGRDTVYCRPGEDFQFSIRHITAFFSEKPVTGGKSPD